MDQKQTHYDLLGVTPTSTDDQLREAFRRLALVHHPDKNPDNNAEATSAFAALKDAYDTLSDPDLRATYDVQHGIVSGIGGGRRWMTEYGGEESPSLEKRLAGEMRNAVRSLGRDPGDGQGKRAARTAKRSAEKFARGAFMEKEAEAAWRQREQARLDKQWEKANQTESGKENQKGKTSGNKSSSEPDTRLASKEDEEEPGASTAAERHAEKLARLEASFRSNPGATEQEKREKLFRIKQERSKMNAAFQQAMMASSSRTLERHSGRLAPGSRGWEIVREEQRQNGKLWKAQAQLSQARLRELELSRKLIKDVEDELAGRPPRKEPSVVFKKSASPNNADTLTKTTDDAVGQVAQAAEIAYLAILSRNFDQSLANSIEQGAGKIERMQSRLDPNDPSIKEFKSLVKRAGQELRAKHSSELERFDENTRKYDAKMKMLDDRLNELQGELKLKRERPLEWQQLQVRRARFQASWIDDVPDDELGFVDEELAEQFPDVMDEASNDGSWEYVTDDVYV